MPASPPGWSGAAPRRRDRRGFQSAPDAGACRDTFASPKSRILACPRSRDENVRRLDVAMDDAFARARRRARRQSRSPGPSSTLGLQRAARDLVLQGHAIEELHDDEGLAMLPRRCRGWCRCWDGSARKRPAPRAGSAPVPADRGRRRQAGTSERRNAEPRVLGLVNHAHPAAAELFQDAVVRNRGLDN